jgi:hypothetical protein
MYLIVNATSTVYVVKSCHEWQVAHDAGILTAFLGTHFPSAATAARFVLIAFLYAPNEAGGIWVFETPCRASKQPDAVYRLGWKNSRRIGEMCFTKDFGPLPVVFRCFMK